jgi:hypothetical protein
MATLAFEKQERARLRIEVLDAGSRLNVYKLTLKNIKIHKRTGWGAGFCTNLPVEYRSFDYTKRMALFPELRACKPPKLFGKGWWFDPADYETRITILESVIKQMEEELNEK